MVSQGHFFRKLFTVHTTTLKGHVAKYNSGCSAIILITYCNPLHQKVEKLSLKILLCHIQYNSKWSLQKAEMSVDKMVTAVTGAWNWTCVLLNTQQSLQRLGHATNPNNTVFSFREVYAWQVASLTLEPRPSNPKPNAQTFE